MHVAEYGKHVAWVGRARGTSSCSRRKAAGSKPYLRWQSDGGRTSVKAEGRHWQSEAASARVSFESRWGHWEFRNFGQLRDSLLWREIDTRPICPRRKNCPN